jgi:hypothetical protein
VKGDIAQRIAALLTVLFATGWVAAWPAAAQRHTGDYVALRLVGGYSLLGDI